MQKSIHRDQGIRGSGDRDIRGSRDQEIRISGDRGTRRQGDKETGGQGDWETGWVMLTTGVFFVLLKQGNLGQLKAQYDRAIKGISRQLGI